MTLPAHTIADEVKAYCAAMGTDPLLVQGGGGNVSWKDDNVLWVKASGAWLADALDKDIFVPVDLAHLRRAVAAGDFGATPPIIGPSTLRPSIETMLHALLPHKVVVHIHAVEILAHLVRVNPLVGIQRLIPDTVKWGFVDYFKPGAELAGAVSACINEHLDANVLFLRNHGIIVGGESTPEIRRIIETLTKAFATTISEHSYPEEPQRIDGYVYYPDNAGHQLAKNHQYFDCLKTKWALYPDHVVFLGPHPYAYTSINEFNSVRRSFPELPELVFIRGEGVYILPHFSKAKAAQLLCYFEVIRRQESLAQLSPLADEQVSALIHWEAEEYRKKHAP
jgi:rhamnose utilization protein RhaD (predicted bifunctional aldolase and dehydrogenase)